MQNEILLPMEVATKRIKNFNEGEYDPRKEMIELKLQEMDNPGWVHTLDSFTDDQVIYRLEDVEAGNTFRYKINYNVSADGTIEFTGRPVSIGNAPVRIQSRKTVQDNSDILLPTQFNKPPVVSGNNNEDDDSPLLPTGLN